MRNIKVIKQPPYSNIQSEGKINISNEYLPFLLKLPLFRGADESLLESAIADGCVLEFHTGESICHEGNKPAHLGIILSGNAKALSSDEERQVVLRTFEKGDTFGLSSVFSEQDCEYEKISRIYAKSTCRVLFITDTSLSSLLESDKAVMYNYIRFLTGRIRFLNKRISCFTAGSAERRLALYLDTLAEDSENNEAVNINVSLGTVASLLDIGRASLYRAIDCLTEDGFIQKKGKCFIIKDRKSMIKKYIK